MLGELYYEKLFDYVNAFKYYKLAADMETNIAPVYNILGAMYSTGKGVDIDYDAARKCYKKAISLGYEISKRNLVELDNALLTYKL